MSKRGYISRYLLILKILKNNPYSSFEVLKAHLEKELENLQMHDDDLQIGFSKRTLQRDMKEIRNVFGIDIEYSKSPKGYFISHTIDKNMNFQGMLEAFDIFNSLNIAHDLSPFIHMERRKPQGTENLYGLIHAIKNKQKIKFTYQKFWHEDPSFREAEPYALKEFKNRWYLMAKDKGDQNIKSFALDRLTHLEITNQRFQDLENQNIEHNYRYCFGIICPQNETPQDIVLSFTAFQGKYIKTLPLHETQQLLVDDEKETRIKLKLFITLDLVMELLSFGDKMRVIEPKSLADLIKQEHQKAVDLY